MHIQEITIPQEIKVLLNYLTTHSITPVIVGGYTRDYFLNIDSKDIDIELYNVTDIELLQSYLNKFSSVNCVGKSFGVFKLKIADYELDFTLARTESKISSGHRGFNVSLLKQLSFKEAALRRDFTINSIGYDYSHKKFLDPYHGRDDLKQRVLKVVSVNTFMEDPLRVLRAMQFCARFHLKIDNELLELSKELIHKDELQTLSKERIYLEFEKLFIKADKPSLGFYYLQNIDAFYFFKPLQNIQFEQMCSALDRAVLITPSDIRFEILLSLSSLFILKSKDTKEVKRWINQLTTNKKVTKQVLTLVLNYNSFKTAQSDFDYLQLATKVELYKMLLLHKSIENKNFIEIETKINELRVEKDPLKRVIEGRDLIEIGLKPSKEFSTLLEKIYEAQLHYNFTTKAEAIRWVKTTLL